MKIPKTDLSNNEWSSIYNLISSLNIFILEGLHPLRNILAYVQLLVHPCGLSFLAHPSLAPFKEILLAALENSAVTDRGLWMRENTESNVDREKIAI